MKIRILILISIVGVLLLALMLTISNEACGYINYEGFQEIPCKCIGIKYSKNRVKGSVIEPDKMEYCLGISNSKICFEKKSVQQMPDPFLCL